MRTCWLAGRLSARAPPVECFPTATILCCLCHVVSLLCCDVVVCLTVVRRCRGTGANYGALRSALQPALGQGTYATTSRVCVWGVFFSKLLLLIRWRKKQFRCQPALFGLCFFCSLGTLARTQRRLIVSPSFGACFAGLLVSSVHVRVLVAAMRTRAPLSFSPYLCGC